MGIFNKMVMKKSSLFFCYICLLTISSGCFPVHKLYDGNQRPRSEIAIISYRWTETKEGVIMWTENGLLNLKEIDGKKCPINIYNFKTREFFVEVLPGLHTLTFNASDKIKGNTCLDSRQPITIKFEAKAGETYIVESEIVDVEWWRVYVMNHWQRVATSNLGILRLNRAIN